MARNHKKSSPYYDTPIVGGLYLDVWNPRIIERNLTDFEYTVPPKYAGRPDLIAYEFYNNPNYWWIIQSMNMDLIDDPLTDLVEGMVIRLPDPDRLIGGGL